MQLYTTDYCQAKEAIDAIKSREITLVVRLKDMGAEKGKNKGKPIEALTTDRHSFLSTSSDFKAVKK